MLAALILWAYLAVLLYLYGASAVWLLTRGRVDPAPLSLELPLILLTGMMLLGTLAAVLSLFIPLSWPAALILLAAAILLYASVRPRVSWAMPRPRGAEWLAVAVLLIAALIVLENATHATSNPDTNLYHAQTIRWAETYRAVSGLGNLNGRLAFNSDWLVLNAATSFAFLGLRSFHLIAGLLFLLSVTYFIGGLFGLLHCQFALSNWLKLLFLPLAFWVLTGEISSPGTDLPVILLTWVLMALSAEYLEAGQRWDTTSGQAMLIALLPAFIATLKLSAAPLLLVTAWMLVVMYLQHHWRRAWTVALLALAILLPWAARSVIQSGYLIFPYSRLDLFSFDWKVPADYADSVRNGIAGWARLPDKDWTQVVRLPLTTWLPAWFAQQTLNQRGMIVVAFISPAALLFATARRYAVPILINYAGLWFWLLSAPNLRFGYGFLLSGLAFIMAAILVFAIEKIGERRAFLFSLAAGASVLLFLAYTLLGSLDAGSLQKRLILPIDYRTFRTTPCTLGNLALSCALAYRQCGYAAFPCVPNIPPGVLPRGSTFQDGFYSTR